jgi:hypothetical protein
MWKISNIFKQHLPNIGLKEIFLCFIIIMNSLIILIGSIHVSLIINSENIEYEMFYLLIFSLLSVLMIISGVVTVIRINIINLFLLNLFIH